jgi:Ca2+-binding RTX toxin-like protein
MSKHSSGKRGHGEHGHGSHGGDNHATILNGSLITGTDGHDKLVAGSNDTLTGGGGSDEFVIGKAAAGATVITDFNALGPDADIIDLRKSGLDASSFDALKTHITENGSDAVIDLGNGRSVTLQNVGVGALTAANFELAGSGKGDSHGGGKGGGAHHGPGVPSVHADPFKDFLKLIGTTGDDLLTATDAKTVLIGGGGNDSLTGGAGGDLVVGGAGNDTLNGAGGNDTLIAGGGNDMLSGGAGKNVFSIAGEHGTLGTVEITDFVANGADAGVIRLEHTGLDAHDFTGLMTHMTQVGANAVLDLGSGHTLTLDNVDMATLTAADFILQ